MKKRAVTSLILLLLATAAQGQTFKDDSHWFMEASAMVGQANGRLQTPAGGSQGSVTPSEPQFDESSTLSAQFTLGYRFDQHLVFFNYRNWGFGGTDTYQSLPQNNPTPEGNNCVVIQNSVFCNGETVSARVDMDWLSFGYGYTFNFTMSGGSTLTLTPYVQGDIYRFEMEIERENPVPWGLTGDRVDRRYSKGGLRLGGVLEWAQNDWLVWGTRLATSVVLPSAPASTDLEAYASFRLWDTAGTRGTLRAGVGYTYFRYTDQQTVPNDLVVELGPSPLLALAVQF